MLQWKDLKDVIGYYGANYEVSEQGQIRNKLTERILKGGDNGHGYHQLRLSNNKKAKTFKIHRLVALAFIPNPANKPMVNHKDGNQLNNDVSNLEWVTNQENLKHAFDNGIAVAKVGEDSNNSKLSESDVIEIKQLLTKGIAQREVARRFDMHYQAIADIQQGKTWAHVHVEGFKPFKGGKTAPPLTEAEVRKIRELYATGNYKAQELATMFGKGRRAIDDIVKRRTWKHLID